MGRPELDNLLSLAVAKSLKCRLWLLKKMGRPRRPRLPWNIKSLIWSRLCKRDPPRTIMGAPLSLSNFKITRETRSMSSSASRRSSSTSGRPSLETSIRASSASSSASSSALRPVSSCQRSCWAIKRSKKMSQTCMTCTRMWTWAWMSYAGYSRYSLSMMRSSQWRARLCSISWILRTTWTCRSSYFCSPKQYWRASLTTLP